MIEAKASLEGLSPLMMHSDRLVNPFDPLARELKKVSGKRTKTDDDYMKMSYIEFVAGLYHDEDIGPYIPSKVLKAAMIRGAAKSKEGPKIKGGVQILEEKNSLIYKGPREIDELWEQNEHVDIRSVGIGKKRVMRTRPIFPDWRVKFELHIDESVLDKDDVKRILQTTGKLLGICELRPELGGNYGRFLAKEVK